MFGELLDDEEEMQLFDQADVDVCVLTRIEIVELDELGV
jgi:hypothetical protein